MEKDLIYGFMYGMKSERLLSISNVTKPSGKPSTKTDGSERKKVLYEFKETAKLTFLPSKKLQSVLWKQFKRQFTVETVFDAPERYYDDYRQSLILQMLRTEVTN